MKLVRLGHPALRARSKSVIVRELRTKRFQKFLDDLADTCKFNKGVGIAAPQVGVNKRVIVVHVSPKNPRYPDKKPFPLTIVINPKITQKSSRTNEDWEGDLSADIRGLVPRSVSCVVTGLSRQGEPVEYKLDNDFHARVFQHEIDHLNGIFFIDKVKRKETLAETAEWKKYWKNDKRAHTN
jgi:peptide deformylase